jgi:hypothetical protein
MKDNERDWLHHLFGRDRKKESEGQPPPKPANHVPAEGNNPEPAPDKNADMRRFVKDLFDRAL